MKTFRPIKNPFLLRSLEKVVDYPTLLSAIGKHDTNRESYYKDYNDFRQGYITYLNTLRKPAAISSTFSREDMLIVRDTYKIEISRDILNKIIPPHIIIHKTDQSWLNLQDKIILHQPLFRKLINMASQALEINFSPFKPALISTFLDGLKSLYQEEEDLLNKQYNLRKTQLTKYNEDTKKLLNKQSKSQGSTLQSSIQNTFNKYKKEAEDLQTKIKDVGLQLQEYQKASETLSEENKALSQEIESLKTDIKSLQEEIVKDADLKLEDLEDDSLIQLRIKATDKTLNDLHIHHTKLTSQNQELEKSIQAQQQKKATLEASIQNITQERNQLLQEESELDGELSDLKQQAGALDTQLSDSEKNLQTLQTNAKTLQKEIKEQKLKQSEKLQTLTNLESQKEKILTDINSREQKISRHNRLNTTTFRTPSDFFLFLTKAPSLKEAIEEVAKYFVKEKDKNLLNLKEFFREVLTSLSTSDQTTMLSLEERAILKSTLSKLVPPCPSTTSHSRITRYTKATFTFFLNCSFGLLNKLGWLDNNISYGTNNSITLSKLYGQQYHQHALQENRTKV